MSTNKNPPHKHAALIKAWADGAIIQCLCSDGIWEDIFHPSWSTEREYRIKPEPKPDFIKNVLYRFGKVWKTPTIRCSWDGNCCPDGYKHNLSQEGIDHIRFIFDGETGKLKSVELI